MSNQRIFELIRKEEVVLFVGAGMSYYAGYPLGGGLAQILYDKLTDDVRANIEFTYNLPKICQDIYTMKGGNKSYLIETLKEEFKKKPKNTETHVLLAGIPHFKNIITTNYDTLIETTNPNIEVIRKSIDLSTTNSKSQLLFKIHSDFTDIERLILTERDYQNYFVKNSENSIFWNAVKNKLATNHILFIGYSLEDINVNVLINKIIDELGEHRKEIYFVSPGEKPVKLQFLKNSNINYIESTGENFVKEVVEDIRKNYLPGLGKGIGNADTALTFAKSKNLSIDLKKSEEGIEIGSVKSLDSNSSYVIDLKLELSGEEKKKYNDFLQNKNFDELNLDAKTIKELSFIMKDLVIRNQDSLSKITLHKRPNFEGKINIVFEEDDFEVDNYPFLFIAINPEENQNHIKIVVDDFTIIIKFNFDPVGDKHRFHMEIFPPGKIKSTYSGLQFYQLLSRISSNKKFKIRKDGKPFYNSDQFPLPFTPNAFDSQNLLDYFAGLKKIEKYFDMVFVEINLHEAQKDNLKMILSFIDSEPLFFPIQQIEVNIKESEIELFKKLIDEESELLMSNKTKTIINLHGQDFDLGYKLDFISDPIIFKSENINDKTSKIQIGSKTNQIGVRFSEENILEN